MNKKVLTMQDISCYGQCSITVALPIISAWGHETAILPSAILSTHTSGFKNLTVHDLSNNDLLKSTKIAAKFVVKAIENTLDDPNHNYSVKFEPLLVDFIKENR